MIKLKMLFPTLTRILSIWVAFVFTSSMNWHVLMLPVGPMNFFLKVEYFSDNLIPVNTWSSTELLMPETWESFLITFPFLHLASNKSPSPVKSTCKNIYYISSLFCITLVLTFSQGLLFITQTWSFYWLQQKMWIAHYREIWSMNIYGWTILNVCLGNMPLSPLLLMYRRKTVESIHK